MDNLSTSECDRQTEGLNYYHKYHATQSVARQLLWTAHTNASSENLTSRSSGLMVAFCTYLIFCYDVIDMQVMVNVFLYCSVNYVVRYGCLCALSYSNYITKIYLLLKKDVGMWMCYFMRCVTHAHINSPDKIAQDFWCELHCTFPKWCSNLLHL